MAGIKGTTLTVISPPDILKLKLDSAASRLQGVAEALELMEAEGNEHAGLQNILVTELLNDRDLLEEVSELLAKLDSAKAGRDGDREADQIHHDCRRLLRALQA
jgi:hypothetical protein